MLLLSSNWTGLLSRTLLLIKQLLNHFLVRAGQSCCH